VIEFAEVQNLGEQLLWAMKATKACDLSLSYDRQSLDWLDGYIERNRHIFSEERRYHWAISFGYILGEAIIRAFGGTWEYNQEYAEWMVNVGPSLFIANPIGKVYKHLTESCSTMTSYFDVTGMFKERGGLPDE
jgi:hypothetical protein